MAEKTMNEKEKYLDEIEDKIRTIGVLTSGGDAPGMNAAIRAVVRRALAKGLKVRGIRRGYHGLLKEEIIDLTARDVSDIVQRGGTILQTARCKTMRTEEGQQKAAAICKKYGIDGLVVIGGDGSFAGAQKLANLGVNTIGVPGTIDLDIACTDYTIGFDTAVNTAMYAIDKVRDTSTSHERCSVIEVMGRDAGYLALWCGIANGAERILMPEEHGFDEKALIEDILENKKRGKQNYIIINAEGVGDSINLAKRIEDATGICHNLRLVYSGNADVYIEHICSGVALAYALFKYIVHIAAFYCLFKFLFAGGIYPLTDEHNLAAYLHGV